MSSSSRSDYVTFRNEMMREESAITVLGAEGEGKCSVRPSARLSKGKEKVRGGIQDGVFCSRDLGHAEVSRRKGRNLFSRETFFANKK